VTDAAVQAEPATDPIKTVLMKDQGARLPLGVEGPDGSFRKDISVRPWRMKEERELGALRDQNKDANVAQYVSMVLGSMCTRLGLHDFEQPQMKLQQKQLAVGQMFIGDVFYAYVHLRLQTLGPELLLNLTCPGCQNKIENFAADLNTVEVQTCEKLADACWEYHLHSPITIRGKEVTDLVMGPARWNALEMLKGGGIGTAKPAMIQASVHALGTIEDSHQAVITEAELDEMSKRDIEALTKLIDKHSIGPNMAVEGKCGKCGRPFRLPIDWGYDGFFGDSTQ